MLHNVQNVQECDAREAKSLMCGRVHKNINTA